MLIFRNSFSSTRSVLTFLRFESFSLENKNLVYIPFEKYNIKKSKYALKTSTELKERATEIEDDSKLKKIRSRESNSMIPTMPDYLKPTELQQDKFLRQDYTPETELARRAKEIDKRQRKVDKMGKAQSIATSLAKIEDSKMLTQNFERFDQEYVE